MITISSLHHFHYVLSVRIIQKSGRLRPAQNPSGFGCVFSRMEHGGMGGGIRWVGVGINDVVIVVPSTKLNEQHCLVPNGY